MTSYSELFHSRWWFSTAMFNSQRVLLLLLRSQDRHIRWTMMPRSMGFIEKKHKYEVMGWILAPNWGLVDFSDQFWDCCWWFEFFSACKRTCLRTSCESRKCRISSSWAYNCGCSCFFFNFFQPHLQLATECWRYKLFAVLWWQLVCGVASPLSFFGRSIQIDPDGAFRYSLMVCKIAAWYKYSISDISIYMM